MASKRKAPAAEEEGGGEEVDQESRINKLQKEKQDLLDGAPPPEPTALTRSLIARCAAQINTTG